MGKLEAGYKNFKIGALIQETRVEKGLKQEQLGEKWAQQNHIYLKLKTILKKFGFQHFRKL